MEINEPEIQRLLVSGVGPAVLCSWPVTFDLIFIAMRCLCILRNVSSLCAEVSPCELPRLLPGSS